MKVSVNLPDFSITRGQIPADSPAPVRRRNWGRTLRRVFGWGAVGVFFFLLFGWLALPTKAIAWRISYEAKKAGYVVDVEDVSIMPWGSATLENVTWTFEPSRPNTPPQQYFMEEIDVSIGVLAALSGNIDVEVDIEREDGTINASYEQGSSETVVEVHVDGLPLYDVPKAAQALNVPLYGLLKIDAKISAPGGKFAKSEGEISVACSACRAGDGESKLYVPGGARSLRDGITFPEIDLGTLTGKLEVEKGVAKIEEPIATESEDLIMSLTGRLKLKDPFQSSMFKMVLEVELTPSFLERAERLALVYRGASPESRLDPPKRGLGFRLEGPVAKARFRGVKTKTTAEKLAERRKKRRDRKRRRGTKKGAKKGKKNTAAEPKDDKEPADPRDAREEPKDDADDGRDARDERGDDERPTLDIKPLDDEEEEPSRDGRPALPPPAEDEGDEIEVFDPNEQGDGQDDGQGNVDDGQGQGDDGQGFDDGQGNGDDGQGNGDGQGQGDDGQGNGGGSGGQQQPVQ